MVLAVWSLLEQRVYGRSLVWLTHTASLGRFADNQYVSTIIGNLEMQRIVEVCFSASNECLDVTATILSLIITNQGLICNKKCLIKIFIYQRCVVKCLMVFIPSSILLFSNVFL